MKVNFKIINQESATTEGSYTEIWASPEKSRCETAVGDFHRLQVVNGKKQWISSSSSTAPAGVEHLGFRMNLPLFSQESWVDKIDDRASGSVSMRCLESHPNSMGGRSAVCLDRTTGLVSTRVQPVSLGDRPVDRTCTYSDYQKFGDKLFPRVERCSEDRKPIFESTLIELTQEGSPDANLFAPLANSVESVHCGGVPAAPQPVYSPDPFPPRRENPPHPIVLLLTVGADGIPRDVKVVRSYDSAFDNAAMEAVRTWRFKPASCDGQPVEVQINVEVTFRVFSR